VALNATLFPTMSEKPFIIDSHCDLAWNMQTYGRDYTRSAAETRRLEKGSAVPESNGDSLIGWPDYQRGRVALVFSTLFASPARARMGAWDTVVYSDYEEAHRLYLDQLHLYRQLADSKPDHFRLILNTKDLRHHMDEWGSPEKKDHPVGLLPLMEGADAIRSPAELEEWYSLGLRLIGLAWAGTRYAGGTREPGPLTEEGRRLLKAMASFNFTLDLSHMDEQSALEALDLYEGPLAASHANCLALLPNFPTNRHLSDRVMRGLIERDGVIGIIPVNSFLKSGWSLSRGGRRDEVTLDVVAAHLDHVCQLAGDARHVGLGTDFDGGFGLQSVPPELDTIADLQKLVPLLVARGYSESDAAYILGGNWLNFLEKNLPS
jgi:membrane dipeptidase